MNSPFRRVITNENQPGIILYAIKCLEACTETLDSKTNLNEEQMQFCIKVFHSYLLNDQSNLGNFDETAYFKVSKYFVYQLYAKNLFSAANIVH